MHTFEAWLIIADWDWRSVNWLLSVRHSAVNREYFSRLSTTSCCHLIGCTGITLSLRGERTIWLLSVSYVSFSSLICVSSCCFAVRSFVDHYDGASDLACFDSDRVAYLLQSLLLEI